VQLVRLLLLLHLGITAGSLALLWLVVAGQRARAALAARRARRGSAPAPADLVPYPEVPASGASVLDWSVDLRGVGQREAALRT